MIGLYTVLLTFVFLMVSPVVICQDNIQSMRFSDSIYNLHLITDETLKHHFSSFIDNDLEEIMSDYTNESIIITPEQDIAGLAAIRAFFLKAMELYPQGSTTITIDRFVSADNLAYVVWHVETPTFIVDFSTATYLIIDQKIARHTIGRVIRSKE